MRPALVGYAFGAAVAADATVDLGYASYRGYHDDAYGLDVWKGIRYAAPPVGELRWQAPLPPAVNNTQVTPAVDQPPLCPQTGAFGLPPEYGFTSGLGDEDCLFLNVYAAPNAKALPVLVWIHGGGYGLFGALYDPSVWINSNDNGFIVVQIQYRLGAFGFLSSEEVLAHGQLNAGLLDQRLALEWVREHITKFGGDPARVTIAGESAGAGSVMLHALAHGGEPSDLFSNIWAASPYSPPVYEHDDPVPTGNYDAFANLAGCGGSSSTRGQFNTTFDCLVAADSAVLQNASGIVSTTRGYWGSFAFLPVIDGEYIQMLPSDQLALGKVAGKRILVGNNANDGTPLTDPKLLTHADFDAFIATTYPNLTDADASLLNTVYKTETAQEGNSGVRFDTLGNSGPTALTQSDMATGIQQTAFNVAAESQFDCPAQWLAEAFSTAPRQAWKYQYSLTPSYHGADLGAYFAVNATVPNEDFGRAMQKMLGNFVIKNSPVIAVEDATAGYSNATVPIGEDGQIAWPEYTLEEPWQMDLNTTGGTTTLLTVTENLSYSVRMGEGIVNNFRVVNASAWEGGRGTRCEFWRSVAARVPQ